MPYTVHRIDLTKGDQKQPEFLRISPKGRIPAIVDRANGDFAVLESGAILLYWRPKRASSCREGRVASHPMEWRQN